jgi:hypothetical protein
MKKELIDRARLFEKQKENILFAVVYKEQYKESYIDDTHITGINPNPQMVECEQVDFFETIIEANERANEVKKIKKYYDISICDRNALK